MSATRRRRLGSILILLAFVLAVLPVPFWLELAVLVLGGGLFFSGLPWSLP